MEHPDRRQDRTDADSTVVTPRSPYDTTVAASGIIEAANEKCALVPHRRPVTRVLVAVGDRVRDGDPLASTR